MIKKYFRLLAGIFIAILFLWLALKDVSLYEVRLTMDKMTYYWIMPYLLVSLFSHYIRAERWKQLIERDEISTSRTTLFSGVMLGYLINYAVPRLGEVSRSVYVGNLEGISRTRLMGTVVLERFFDLLVMLLLMLFVAFYFLRDYSLIIAVLGTDTVRWLKALWSPDGMLIMGLAVTGAVLLLVAAYYLFLWISRWLPSVLNMINTLKDTATKFFQGLMSIREIRNWPLFILFTAVIWLCYILMTYIPFTAFGMHNEFGLGLQEALVITVISALGVALPSPGGIGTYHWFVSRSLLLLFAVPEAVGVAYAIVTHLVMMIIILTATPVILAFNRLIRSRNEMTIRRDGQKN